MMEEREPDIVEDSSSIPLEKTVHEDLELEGEQLEIALLWLLRGKKKEQIAMDGGHEEDVYVE